MEHAVNINDYAAKMTGNATFTDEATPTANTGASDIRNIIPGGLVDSITITDEFLPYGDDEFEAIDVTIVDGKGKSTTSEIDTAEGSVTIDDGTDDIDLTALPLKVYLVVKTDLAPEGKIVQFFITED